MAYLISAFDFNLIAFFISVFMVIIPSITLYERMRMKVKNDINKGAYISKITFCCNNFLLYEISIIICTLGLKAYEYVSSAEFLGIEKHLFETGIIIPFMLFGLGVLIRKIYSFSLKKCNIKDILKETDKEIIFAVTLLILAILFIKVENLSLFVIFVVSIVIGKYIWLDTTIPKLRLIIDKNWNENKYSIICGVVILAIMIPLEFLPEYIDVDSAISVWIGLVVSVLILVLKAFYDNYKVNNK